AVRATEIGRRFSDADLTAMGILGQGQALVGRGEHERGLALLDEAMVGVTAGEVRPVAAGIIYCAVIETSMRAYDLRRAGEWTAALTRWCEAQPDLVPYRGQCLVHQAQVLQARGSWADAAAAAGRARSHLAEPPHPALGLAAYQEGELHRLRGEFASAEQAYRAASQHGREPLPGLALLRLAQGRPDVAATSIRRALDGTSDPGERPELLAAAVEIMRVAGDLEGARSAADELAAHAAARDAPALLRALAAHAVGAVALAAGEARSALAVLRDAAAGWQLLDMPYEAARTRVLVGLACAALGDADGADLELASARRAFDELGAVPDLARLDAITGGGRPRPAGLTERELEVLRLLATGRSNRAIAEDLVISEHTVARHVQNLFAKLGVSSRAGATAYAYEHQLA
ncbi:MAG TPA: LuxR C-terminal-related transcriptional regulator, partial [Acidimicrobiia bacterium]|nr:LuxR C-terminal-related transcriptional regulator [Acidimicrobiia bacterium]